MSAPDTVKSLVERFEQHRDAYRYRNKNFDWARLWRMKNSYRFCVKVSKFGEEQSK